MVNQQAAVSKVAAGSTTSELQPVGFKTLRLRYSLNRAHNEQLKYWETNGIIDRS